MSSLIINYGLCIAISTFLSCVGYKFLYSAFKCSALSELIVGHTIFQNYDKSIDFLIYFIYIGLFFVCFFVLNKFIPNFEFNIKIPQFTLPELNGNERILKCLQTICSLFYFLFYPNNGTTYPILLFAIILLVVLANADIYFKVISKNSKISPFAIAPLVIFFLGMSYNFGVVKPDDYHFGERLGSFYLIDFQGYKIFKDILLIHGFNDLFAGFISKNIFNEVSLYGFYLADTLIYNINLLLSFLLGWHVFSKNKALISGVLLNCFSYFNVYFLIALSMFKKNIFERPFLWLKIYLILAFFLSAFWFQFGIFLILALFPVAVFMLTKLLTFKQYKQILYLCLLFLALFLLFKSFIISSLNYHLNVNTLSYANGYPELKISQLWSNFIKLFALLALPCFVIEAVKVYKLNSIRLYYVYLFSIIFVLAGLVYMLTKIDFIMFSRARFISIAYLCILLPFIFTLTKSKWLNVSQYILTFALVIVVGVNFKFLDRWETLKTPEENKISAIGRLLLDENYQKNIENLKTFVDANSEKQDYFLDLTNRGLLYFILDRKNPCSQMAFFNVTSGKQEQEMLNNIKKYQPKIVLLNSNNIQHDKIYPSLRVNSVYKWLLSNNYKLVNYNDNLFLVKSNKKLKYTNAELKILDEILTNPELKRLPLSWGNSVEKLNLTQGKDLVFFNLKTNEPTSVKVGMRGSSSELIFETEGNLNVLVPLDIFASWYLNPNEIVILADKQIEISEMRYFGRNFNN